MEENKINVIQDHGEFAPTILFIFSTFCFMFWGLYMGWIPASSSLCMGCIMLASLAPYIYSFICYIRKGDTLNGTVFGVFCWAFAGCGASMHFINYYCYVTGAVVDTTIFNMVWIAAGIFVIPIVVGMRKGPIIPFLTFGLAVIQLIFMGCIGFGWLPAGLTPLVTWICFLIGVGGYYTFISFLLAASGVRLPLGPALVK